MAVPESSESQQRNRDQVLQRVFEKFYKPGADEVTFSMDDVRDAIAQVAKAHPGYKEKNVADVRYQYTSGRRPLPEKNHPTRSVDDCRTRKSSLRLRPTTIFSSDRNSSGPRHGAASRCHSRNRARICRQR